MFYFVIHTLYCTDLYLLSVLPRFIYIHQDRQHATQCSIFVVCQEGMLEGSVLAFDAIQVTLQAIFSEGPDPTLYIK